jgi:type IV secretory pathway VirB2 component (pilin)
MKIRHVIGTVLSSSLIATPALAAGAGVPALATAYTTLQLVLLGFGGILILVALVGAGIMWFTGRGGGIESAIIGFGGTIVGGVIIFGAVNFATLFFPTAGALIS